MTKSKEFIKWRVYLTALILILELVHLAWEYFNGGVPSHHLLNNPDLPAISNWWGALLLPAIAWFLSGGIQKRLALQPASKVYSVIPSTVIGGFVGALLFGISLSLSFSLGYETLSSYLFFGMLLIALIFPVYRGEYILGFILGMTFTFGAILPTIISLIIAILSMIIHLYIYPLFKHFRTVFGGK